MKLLFATLALTATLALAAPAEVERPAGLPGIDVSHYQGNINWDTVKSNGVAFVYIKATEGTTYKDPKFSDNYVGATRVKIIRGGYHFAHPDSSSGAKQALWFLANGGGWTKDGRTLPGMLDLEYNTHGSTCYGLSHAGMVSWIRDFSNTYHSKTGRYPTIYTSTSWWNTCTGGSKAFGKTNPLMVARYSSSVGTLPAGWSTYTIWQYADHGSSPGDQDVFNGSQAQLVKFATG